MTKITIDRAVAEQALHVATAAGYPVALIAALRAALAEPVQEPVKQCMAHGECFGGKCIYQCPSGPVQEPGFWGRVAARQASRIKHLEATAQQALEAMRCAVPTGKITLTDWMKANRDLEAALAEPVQEPDTCTWQQDGDNTSGAYGTSCRHYFHLEDGTPEDNRMKWCCYCGKKLAQELITEDEDE